jgi:hypothetical protein
MWIEQGVVSNNDSRFFEAKDFLFFRPALLLAEDFGLG